MASSTHFTIDRLRALLKKANHNELKSFLLMEKGFRSEQYSLSDNNWSLLHYVAGREFESAEEADEWISYASLGSSVKGKAVDTGSNTPLHHACLFGSIFGVKWLLEHIAGIEIDSPNKCGRTPFMNACLTSVNRLAKVRYLVENGAKCRTTDKYKRTALFYATKCEDEDVKDHLRYLVIENGIDINSVDMWGLIPLLYACKEHPSFVVISLLIELGSDVSAKDDRKQSALHKAAQTTSDKSIIDLLIEKGSDVTSQDNKGKTPHEVARDGEIRALLRKLYDSARFCALQQQMLKITAANPPKPTCDSNSVPSDDALVTENLMRTCAALDASKWEHIGVLLISMGDVEAIRHSTTSDVSRMFKILEAWKNQAESPPTVGKLLAWFKQVGISERAIREKYVELYG